MYGMTPEQRRLLILLATLQRQGEVCPSLDELAATLGHDSKSTAHRLLTALAERGAIRRLRGRARAIEVLPEGMAWARPVEIAGERFRFIPAACLGSMGYER